MVYQIAPYETGPSGYKYSVLCRHKDPQIIFLSLLIFCTVFGNTTTPFLCPIGLYTGIKGKIKEIG
jgi:hypothetical protein